MRGAMKTLDIKAQLLIAVVLVSATGAMSAETDQISVPAAPAATEITPPKADGARKPEARMPQQAESTVAPAAAELTVARPDSGKRYEWKRAHTASNWRCGWGPLYLANWCTGGSGRVGLILGTAY